MHFFRRTSASSTFSSQHGFNDCILGNTWHLKRESWSFCFSREEPNSCGLSSTALISWYLRCGTCHTRAFRVSVSDLLARSHRSKSFLNTEFTEQKLIRSVWWSGRFLLPTWSLFVLRFIFWLEFLSFVAAVDLHHVVNAAIFNVDQDVYTL